MRTAIVGAALAAAVLVAGACGSAPGETRTLTIVTKDKDPTTTITPKGFLEAQPTQGAQGFEDAPAFRDGKKAGTTDTAYAITRGGGAYNKVRGTASIAGAPDGTNTIVFHITK